MLVSRIASTPNKCHRKETWERIRRRPSKLSSRNDKNSQDVWVKRESVHTQTKQNDDQYSQDAVDSSSGLDDSLPRIKTPRPTNLPLCESRYSYYFILFLFAYYARYMNRSSWKFYTKILRYTYCVNLLLYIINSNLAVGFLFAIGLSTTASSSLSSGELLETPPRAPSSPSAASLQLKPEPLAVEMGGKSSSAPLLENNDAGKANGKVPVSFFSLFFSKFWINSNSCNITEKVNRLKKKF